MIELHNWNWSMLMQGGFQGDVWTLGGNVYNHPNFPDGDFVRPSSPVEFDEQRMEIKTYSGKVYKLVNFKQLCPEWNLEKSIQEIHEVVKNGGYDRK